MKTNLASLPFKEMMEIINAKHGFYYNTNSKKKLDQYTGKVSRRIIRGSQRKPEKAGELAGYSEHSYPKVVRNLKQEIISRAENYLATHSAKAATKMVDMLDEDGTTPHANIRLEAAKQILDRIGIAKKDQLDINMKALHGIFILPAKDKLDEDKTKS